MYAALNAMVLEAIEIMYIFDSYNFFTGYMGSSTKDIMNHLVTRYVRIMTADIEDNKKPFKNLWTCHILLMCSSRSFMTGTVC